MIILSDLMKVYSYPKTKLYEDDYKQLIGWLCKDIYYKDHYRSLGIVYILDKQEALKEFKRRLKIIKQYNLREYKNIPLTS